MLLFAFAVVLATISTTLPHTLVTKEVQNGNGKKTHCLKTKGTSSSKGNGMNKKGKEEVHTYACIRQIR